jgi:hypothetical protein
MGGRRGLQEGDRKATKGRREGDGRVTRRRRDDGEGEGEQEQRSLGVHSTFALAYMIPKKKK